MSTTAVAITEDEWDFFTKVYSLIWNSQFVEAEALLAGKSKTNMWHALAYAEVSFRSTSCTHSLDIVVGLELRRREGKRKNIQRSHRRSHSLSRKTARQIQNSMQKLVHENSKHRLMEIYCIWKRK